MKYITRVVSNVKGGVNVSLAPKVLIVGRNEAGKSAVLNSVELALSRRASGIYGRRTVAEHELLSLIAPAKESLISEVEFEDGGRARFEFPKGKKTGVVRYFNQQGLELPNVPWDVETVLPVRPLSAAIEGKADTARKFFLHFAVGDLKREDVLKQIPAPLHARLGQATVGAKSDLSVADLLLYALETAEKRHREVRSEAKGATATAEKVGEGLAPPLTTAEIQALSESVAALRTRVGQLQQQKGAIATALNGPVLAQQQETLKGYCVQALQQAQAKVAELEAAAAHMPPRPVNDGMPRAETLAVMDWHAREGEANCNVCGTAGVGAAAFAARKAVAQQRVQARLTTEENYKSLEAQWKAAQEEIQRTAADIREHDAQIAKLQSEYNQAQANAQQVDIALAQGQSELEGAEARLTKARTVAAQWEQQQRARDVAAEAKKEEDEWKRLIEAIKEAVKTFLDAGAQRIADWVQLRLPPSDRFVLQLRDKAKAVFRFGLERDGRLDIALSEGKWAHVMAALADVCRDQQGFAVIIPEDRGYDPDTLTGVLHSLGSCNAQVIMACTTRPRLVPDGWLIIDADAGEHRSGATPQAPAPLAPTATGQATFQGIA